MEHIAICSKNDLSGLERMIKSRFVTKKFIFQQNVKGMNSFTLDKKDLPEILESIADWINQSFLQEKIDQILNQKYDILTEEEKAQVSCIAIHRIKEENHDFIDMIQEKLLTLFEISNKVNFEGFQRFCLQEYQSELEILIDESLDEYLIEQDYMEFLDLLSYFVEIEDSRFGTLSVVAQPDGSYCYYNEEGREITHECLAEFMEEFADEDADHDDLLISTLIILLPEKICLYGAEYIKNKNLLKTLQVIFEKRFRLFQHANSFTQTDL